MELNVYPLFPLFNKLTNIIEVIIVADPDFFSIPTYTGIKLIKEKATEYTTILIKFFIKIFTVKESWMKFENMFKINKLKLKKRVDIIIVVKANIATIANFATKNFFLFIG